MRSPHTIGDELPLPGTVTFHSAVDADHLSVYWPAGTWPCPEGPRQRGQYFAPSPSTSMIRTSAGAANSTADAAKTHRLNHANGFIWLILHAGCRLALGGR